MALLSELAHPRQAFYLVHPAPRGGRLVSGRRRPWRVVLPHAYCSLVDLLAGLGRAP
jgi:hypothetical protein